MRTSWKDLISEEMERKNESWNDLHSTTLTSEEIYRKFDNGFGGAEGVPFTLWTRNRVYFPVVYDGYEWVGSVPRLPCTERVEHLGQLYVGQLYVGQLYGQRQL